MSDVVKMNQSCDTRCSPSYKSTDVVYKNKGCFFLGESKNGFVISDHSDHGASKKPKNPVTMKKKTSIF